MHTIILEIEDASKRSLLLALLAELDFVRVRKPSDLPGEDQGEASQVALPLDDNQVSESQQASIFDSVGLWEGRSVNGESLRLAAWKR